MVPCARGPDVRRVAASSRSSAHGLRGRHAGADSASAMLSTIFCDCCSGEPKILCHKLTPAPWERTVRRHSGWAGVRVRVEELRRPRLDADAGRVRKSGADVAVRVAARVAAARCGRSGLVSLAARFGRRGGSTRLRSGRHFDPQILGQTVPVAGCRRLRCQGWRPGCPNPSAWLRSGRRLPLAWGAFVSFGGRCGSGSPTASHSPHPNSIFFPGFPYSSRGQLRCGPRVLSAVALANL